jgi:malate synthase
MANSTVTVPTVKVEGTAGQAEAEILTPQALEFLGALSANFEAERQRLLAARVTRGEALRKGQLYDFLPETASVRQSEWRVAPIPADLQDRDHRPSRSQDGDQRTQCRCASLHG